MDTILLFMLPAGLWAQDAGVAATTAAPDATAGALGELATGLNTVWMLLAAMLVFFMQPGFALVEAGFIRTKNTANVLMKNLVDFMFGSILFWFIGFGLMFGIGGFVGAPHFFNLEAMDKIIDNGLPIEGFLIFQTVFCATAATIVSGAMAERTKFSMYLVYTVFISVLIYPVSGHWTWGGGWLMNGDEGSFMMRTFGTTFHDFAGSTVVHSVGGWIALVGAAILGPRIGKYGKDGKSRAIPGHSLTLGQNHRQRIAHRRLPDFPDCILRHGCHHRVRSHGGTYQVLHVSGLYCLYQRTHLSGFRPLDLGRRMADERRRRLLYDEDVRHYFP